MNAKEYQYWVNRLAQYDPRDNKYDDRRSVAYREMIRCNVPLKDRVAINKAAWTLFEERKLKGREITSIWVDEAAEPVYPDGWQSEYASRLRQLNRGIAEQAMRDLATYGNAFVKFNTEGEKQMEKIEWHKPLRAFKTPGHEIVDAKVYTYKSGKQRVVWIDDRVYPVDEQGHAVADVNYGAHWTHKGVKIVENVPEEKFFVGLYRDSLSEYFLTDSGRMTTERDARVMTAGILDRWIVDTRKPAEPPVVNVHDPKDWTVVIGWDNSTTSYGMRTEAEARAVAEKHACEGGDVKVVRVRTTPPPADTARYIQLWRMKESHPWQINKTGHGRQEFTWAETKNRGANPTQCAIKVRD